MEYDGYDGGNGILFDMLLEDYPMSSPQLKF